MAYQPMKRGVSFTAQKKSNGKRRDNYSVNPEINDIVDQNGVSDKKSWELDATMENPFMVTLYFRGENLEPDSITKSLGIKPTEYRKKGEKRNGKDGRSYINPTGIWALQTTTTSITLADHISELKFIIKDLKELDDLHGIDEAFIDIFVCYKRTEHSDSYEFSLTKKNIEDLNSLGLPIQFTVSSFE